MHRRHAICTCRRSYHIIGVPVVDQSQLVMSFDRSVFDQCCIDSKETCDCLTPYRSMASGMPLTEVSRAWMLQPGYEGDDLIATRPNCDDFRSPVAAFSRCAS